jgi:Rrf2 family protein
VQIRVKSNGQASKKLQSRLSAHFSYCTGREHSQKFLEQILLELKRAKLVNSKQGKVGGYYLLKSPDDVSLADIYRIFDGPIALTPCVSLNFYEACDDCVDEAECYLRNELMIVREKTRKSMMEATLTKFINKK